MNHDLISHFGMNYTMNRPWGDWMLSNVEVTRGLATLAMMKRVEVDAVVPSTPDLDFRVWKDMVEEPYKYGDDDWPTWLQLDAKLRTGRGRWRLAAYWNEKDEEVRRADWAHLDSLLKKAMFAFKDRMATRIQATWRGHNVRNTLPGLSCSECLARGPAPERWSLQHVCNACWDTPKEFGFDIPIVLPAPAKPAVALPRDVPDEHGLVPCNGCGDRVCYEGDYGEYRPGYWCSRACAYT